MTTRHLNWTEFETQAVSRANDWDELVNNGRRLSYWYKDSRWVGGRDLHEGHEEPPLVIRIEQLDGDGVSSDSDKTE